MQIGDQNARHSLDAYEQAVTMERIFLPHARRRRELIYPPGTEHWQRFIHYTSAEAATKIITHKRLWLRNATCMSDYREVQHGFSILQRFFSDPEKAKSFTDAIDAVAPGAARDAIAEFDRSWTSGSFPFNTFIASVSEHADEEDVHGRLSMWRAFGGNTARVGLVLRVPYRSPGGEAMNLIFSPVAYFKDDEAHQWLAQVISNVHANQAYLRTVPRPSLTNWIFYMLLLGVTCVKHEGFREEREWRIVHCPHLHSSPLISPATVIVGGVPQIVFSLPLDRSVSPVIEDLEFSNLFDRLIIGPSPYPAPMFAAFTDILANAGVAEAAKKITSPIFRSGRNQSPHTMPRDAAYELTDAEKRDLIKLIEQGKPVPEKYRFLLFDDKREVELVWNGKTREVCTAILPFQTLEHIDEPRKESKDDELGLDGGGRQVKGWTNKLIWGDNKLILASLKAGALRRQIEDAGGLKLIYIDPPFDVGADFSMDIEIGGETFHKEPNLLEQIAYRDTWGRGADSFIAMIYERLILMRDLLHPEGSIYVHCDWRVNSYIRLALNEVFGASCFQNEITWRRTRTHNDATSWAAIADTILFFSRGENFIWNPQFNEQSEEDIETRYRFTDEKGRRYRLGPIDSPNPRPNMMYVWKGFPPPKKGWRYSQEKMAELDREGRIYYPDSNDKRPATKLYLDESQGALVGTVWTEFSAVQASATERVDYPTQKPEAIARTHP